MIVYKDVISSDEIASDGFPVKEIDDFLLEVDCKQIQVKEGIDASVLGSNPSTEEQDEQLDDQVKTVNNVVYTFQLNQVSHDKASYMGHIKEYMKAIKAHLEKSNPARAQVFQEKAKTHVANIVKNIANYEFFVGSSMDPNGLVALLNYREDGITPYFTLFKDGLKMEKV